MRSQPLSLYHAFLQFLRHSDWGSCLAWRKAASQCPRDGGGFGWVPTASLFEEQCKRLQQCHHLVVLNQEYGFLGCRERLLLPLTAGPRTVNHICKCFTCPRELVCAKVSRRGWKGLGHSFHQSNHNNQCLDGAGCHWPFEKPISRRGA